MNILLIEKYSILRIGIRSCIKNKYPDLNLTVLPALPDPDQVSTYEIVLLGIAGEKAAYKNIPLIKELISAKPGIRILLYDGLSASYDQIPIYLKAGIWGYASLLSDTENDFIAGLESLMKGLKYLDPKALHWLLNNPKKHRPATSDDGGVRKLLTSKELQIALALVGGKSITSIARESQRATSTVSTIKKKILEKTAANNLIELKEALARQK